MLFASGAALRGRLRTCKRFRRAHKFRSIPREEVLKLVPQDVEFVDRRGQLIPEGM